MVFGQALVLIAGGIDISVGATMAMSASLAIGLQPYGALAAVGGALIFGVAAGLVNGLLVTRGRIVAFIATLGTMSVLNGLLLTYTGQRSLIGADASVRLVGRRTDRPGADAAGHSSGRAGPALGVSRAPRQGRNLYAIGGNNDAAFLGGVSLERGLLLAFVASGALSALSGVLVASRLNSASVQFGGTSALMTISAALIGGPAC